MQFQLYTVSQKYVFILFYSPEAHEQVYMNGVQLYITNLSKLVYYICEYDSCVYYILDRPMRELAQIHAPWYNLKRN